jgi:thiol-disulfide isomerase/thioredoxin
MKKIAFSGVVMLALLFITSCGGDDDCDTCKEEEEVPANIQVGDPLPEFSVVLKDGKTITKQSLKDKISVVIFFTTTCPDCRALLPSVERIYNEYKESEYFTLICIGREQKASIVDSFWKENEYTLPYSAQETRAVYSLFAPSVVPRVYISDASCTVQYIFTDDPIATYEQLDDIINELVTELCCKL